MTELTPDEHIEKLKTESRELQKRQHAIYQETEHWKTVKANNLRKEYPILFRTSIKGEEEHFTHYGFYYKTREEAEKKIKDREGWKITEHDSSMVNEECMLNLKE